MFVQTAAVLGLASLAVAASSTTSISNTATDTAAVASELATNLPLSPTSNVKGKVFDRIVVLMMENTDLTAAMENRKLRNPLRRKR
jgi:acid phosphatase